MGISRTEAKRIAEDIYEQTPPYFGQIRPPLSRMQEAAKEEIRRLVRDGRDLDRDAMLDAVDLIHAALLEIYEEEVGLERMEVEAEERAAAYGRAHRRKNMGSYEDRERMRANQEMAALSHEPLIDRQEARAEWSEAMRTADGRALIRNAVDNLLAGNYGHGAQLLALDALDRPRMNRLAIIAQMVAAFEWRCPAAFARGAYTKLTPNQKDQVDGAIRAEVNAWIRESGDDYGDFKPLT